MLYINRTIGAIFCQVITSKQFNQSSPSITSGNQKWNGAIPIFVSKEEFILSKNVDWLFMFVNRFLFIISIITDMRITVEAAAWTIKYLIDDSVDRIFFCMCIIGIIDKRLISSPNHIPNHEYEEIEIRVLIKIVDKNRIL